MEVDRRLEPGTRVRIISREAAREIMERNGGEYFPETGGRRLRFAESMFQYCGEECVVHRVTEATNRYTLKLAGTDRVISSWVWCPSMMEDPESEPEPVEPASLMAWILGGS